MKRPEYAIEHTYKGFIIVDEFGDLVERLPIAADWQDAQARIREMVREDDEAERESAA